MKKARRTKKEKQALYELGIRESAAKAVVGNPDSTLRAIKDANAELRKVVKERAEIEAAFTERKQKIRSDEVFAEVAERFPEPKVPPTGAERDALLVQMREAFNALDVEGHAADFGRAYLQRRSDALKAAIAEEKESADTQRNADEEAQEDRDFLAAEKAAREILDKVNPRLCKPLALASRNKLQDHFRQQAKKAREFAETAQGFDETGARKSVVALKIAETFQSVVKRLGIFCWNLDNPPAPSEMDPTFFETACEPQNFNFRSPDGRPTQEQALLVHATRTFYEARGYELALASLPKMPEPVHIPGPTSESLDFLCRLEQQKTRTLPWRQYEEHKRVEELEKLRVENPKEYKKLSEEETRPLQLIDDAETLYLVETATLENPHVMPRLYWPWGEQARPGEDIHWHAPLKCYFHTPEPVVEANWGNGHMEWVQDLRGKWVQQPVQVDAGSKWEQSLDGSWVQVANRATGVSAPPGKLELLGGDHMPLKDDPRTEFRFGHWYTPEQVTAADRATASNPVFFESVPRTELPTLTSQKEFDLAAVPKTTWERRERELRLQENA
jgi:hypothetical protein